MEWGIVLYVAIDGYSRFVTVLEAADHQTALTWRDVMMRGFVGRGCHPKYIRGDCGKENNEVAALIQALRRSDRAFIWGRSVHNQRIERLWRDVNRSATKSWKQLFAAMNECHGLNNNDPVHIYALHVVFMSEIQETLDTWVEHWNGHKIRTAALLTKVSA